MGIEEARTASGEAGTGELPDHVNAPTSISFRESLPKPFSRFAGYAFVQCWVLVIGSGRFLSAEASSPQQFWELAFFSLALILFIVAAVLLAPVIRPLSRRRDLGIAFACLGALGAALTHQAFRAFFPPPLVWVGDACLAACAVWLSLAWQEYFATQGARSATLGFAVTGMVGTALFCLISIMPSVAQAACSIALPFAGLLTLRPHRGARFFTTNERIVTVRSLCAGIVRDCSPRLMTIVCLVSFGFGLLGAVAARQTLVAPSASWVHLALNLSGSCVVVLCVVHFVRSIDVVKVFSVAIAVSALSVALSNGSSGPLMDVAVFLSACAGNLAFFVAWLAMVERSRSRRLPSVALVASLWAANQVGQFAGQVTAEVWPFGAALAGQLVLCALIAASLLLVGLNGRLVLSVEALDGAEETPMGRKVLHVAEACGLTPRETEILGFWATGHNSSYIAELLHISRSTIKTHVTHIYQKTGTSSKEELIGLLETKA